jgi:hypothetical protein
MTYYEHFRIFARFRKDGQNYGKRIDLCDSCHEELENWLLGGGYAKQDIPALPVINPAKEILDLKAQINSLSDIMARQENELADKDREISRLQKLLIGVPQREEHSV